MQRRRRHQEEHENHERWLVSYADFITLLFAFFVVMYSISSINEGKYKILSETLTGVFNQPDRSLKPIPIGDERPRTTEPERTSVEEQPSDNAASADSLERIADSVRDAFGDLIASDQLSVRGNELWIEITQFQPAVSQRRCAAQRCRLRYRREGRQDPGALQEPDPCRGLHR